MALKGIYYTGGVIDAGCGEILICMTLDMNAPPRNENNAVVGYKIQAGRQDRAARTCASRHHVRR